MGLWRFIQAAFLTAVAVVVFLLIPFMGVIGTIVIVFYFIYAGVLEYEELKKEKKNDS